VIGRKLADLNSDPESEKCILGVSRILMVLLLIAANELQEDSVICKIGQNGVVKYA
jgi:hypothetical protein